MSAVPRKVILWGDWRNTQYHSYVFSFTFSCQTPQQGVLLPTHSDCGFYPKLHPQLPSVCVGGSGKNRYRVYIRLTESSRQPLLSGILGNVKHTHTFYLLGGPCASVDLKQMCSWRGLEKGHEMSGCIMRSVPQYFWQSKVRCGKEGGEFDPNIPLPASVLLTVSCVDRYIRGARADITHSIDLVQLSCMFSESRF